MNSVQENKNELEAAVRYCESAISRANATIESMEFRQQAASKAWHEQTGRESALEHAVNDLKEKLVEREESGRHRGRLQFLNDQLAEMSKAYNDSTHEEITMKKAWREQRELVALRDDQIAMLDGVSPSTQVRRSTPSTKVTSTMCSTNRRLMDFICVGSESERIHDARSLSDHPHKVYFVDQKNVLDKFNPEDD